MTSLQGSVATQEQKMGSHSLSMWPQGEVDAPRLGIKQSGVQIPTLPPTLSEPQFPPLGRQ